MILYDVSRNKLNNYLNLKVFKFNLKIFFHGNLVGFKDN